MAVFNCKSCGGDLEIQEGTTVVTCEYCGRQQTVPSADNEKKVNLFNRANRLRSRCEFDKAAGVYESIVAEFPSESEAYWGLCLCKFGIEYVDDPATSAKIPTCHRTSFESIFDDSNFDLACENADALAVNVYRDEAKEIDRLQKEILAIAKNEQPFDVFICYKESDELGGRTVDSELAHDIYDVLTENGYKVFYSRITLKAKLGQDYEPYIFSALNSAKVMLAVGTKFEYFNAVWVKNEWSRFLDLMRKDPTKKLIPCYRDIDAYDLPKEFGNLQGQDLSSPRAFQDLMTNIGRIIPKQQKTAASGVSDPALENILKRAYISLEDGDWDTANKMCEKILDSDAENAQAYLVKLCIDYKLRKPSDLGGLKVPIDGNNNNYQKVLRFGDKALTEEIEGYRRQIIEKTQIAVLVEKFERGGDLLNYIDLVKEIAKYSEFKSANELFEKCREKVYELAEKELDAQNYALAVQGFKVIPGYKDADNSADKIKERIILKSLKEEFEQGGNISHYRDLLEDFEKYSGFKDADEWAEKCREIIYDKAKHAYDAKNFDQAKQGFKAIPGYKDVDEFAKELGIVYDTADEDKYIIRRDTSTSNDVSQEPAAEKSDVSAENSNQNAAIDILTQGVSAQSENERIERVKKSKILAVMLSLAAVAVVIVGIIVTVNVHRKNVANDAIVASELREIAEKNIGEIVEIFNTPINELKNWDSITVTEELWNGYEMSYLASNGKEYNITAEVWGSDYDRPPSQLEVPIGMLLHDKSKYSYNELVKIFGDSVNYGVTINGVIVRFNNYDEDQTYCELRNY